MNHKSLLIGLTGGIASGKSLVANMLAARGASLVDCDIVSRQVVQPGSPCLEELVELFGKQIIDSSGQLCRSQLAEIVYGQPQKLEELNAILHPAIWRESLRQVAQAWESNRVVVLVCPLLFEHSAESLVDTVWVVYVTPALQLKRLQARGHFTVEQAKARIAAQMSLEAKAERADVLIDNCSDPDETARQVEIEWEEHVESLLKQNSSSCSDYTFAALMRRFGGD